MLPRFLTGYTKIKTIDRDNELVKNRDIFEESTFMSKDRDSKLKIGPVWDFDLSSGNSSENPESKSNQPNGFAYPTRRLCDRLFSDPYFVNSYIKRWNELRVSVLSNENLENIIDSMAMELSQSQERNFEKWQILGKHVWPNPAPYAATYEEEMNNLKNWVLERAEWISLNIENIEDSLDYPPNSLQ